jgi:TonB family protein
MITVPRLVPLLVVLIAACATQRSNRPESLVAPAAPSCQGNPSRDTTVFDTTQVSRKPEAISGPSIRYPDELRRQGISGRVVFSVIINADGSLDQRSVERVRSDHPDFEESALQYVREAVYSPGCRDGQAVRVRVALPIDFRIRR